MTLIISRPSITFSPYRPDETLREEIAIICATLGLFEAGSMEPGELASLLRQAISSIEHQEVLNEAISRELLTQFKLLNVVDAIRPRPVIEGFKYTLVLGAIGGPQNQLLNRLGKENYDLGSFDFISTKKSGLPMLNPVGSTNNPFAVWEKWDQLQSAHLLIITRNPLVRAHYWAAKRWLETDGTTVDIHIAASAAQDGLSLLDYLKALAMELELYAKKIST